MKFIKFIKFTILYTKTYSSHYRAEYVSINLRHIEKTGSYYVRCGWFTDIELVLGPTT